MLSEHRDMEAAKRCFTAALEVAEQAPAYNDQLEQLPLVSDVGLRLPPSSGAVAVSRP